MRCDNCKENQATVYYKEIINDEVKEYYLCEECAKLQGLVAEKFQLLPGGLAKMIGSLFDIELPKAVMPKLACCSACGFDYEEFRRIGKLGCPTCYEQFKTRIMNIVRKIHGSTHHTGKLPTSAPEKLRLQRNLQQLKIQLENAIKSEEFELAAQLRDKIRKLQDELK